MYKSLLFFASLAVVVTFKELKAPALSDNETVPPWTPDFSRRVELTSGCFYIRGSNYLFMIKAAILEGPANL